MSDGQYFPPYIESGVVKVDLDLSNYATKTDLKNVTHVDVSSFSSKTNLSDLKTKVDELDIDKLVPVPNDLAKLSYKMANDLTAKIDFNTLKTKVDDIDLGKYILKTKYDSEVGDLKLKILILVDYFKQVFLKVKLLKQNVK